MWTASLDGGGVGWGRRRLDVAAAKRRPFCFSDFSRGRGGERRPRPPPPRPAFAGERSDRCEAVLGERQGKSAGWGGGGKPPRRTRRFARAKRSVARPRPQADAMRRGRHPCRPAGRRSLPFRGCGGQPPLGPYSGRSASVKIAVVSKIAVTPVSSVSGENSPFRGGLRARLAGRGRGPRAIARPRPG